MNKVVLLMSFCFFTVQLSVGIAGSLDTTFNSTGPQPGTNSTTVSGFSTIRGIALQADGKLVVAGYASGYFALARYNTNGTLDATFGSGGTVVTVIQTIDLGNSIVIQPDGKIVVAGSSASGSTVYVALVRYNTDGTLDGTFGSGGKVLTYGGAAQNSAAFAIALQSDGKIVVAGRVGVGSSANIIVVRYNPDGSADTTFGTGGYGAGIVVSGVGSTSQAFGVAIQPNGKIVIAGIATIGSTLVFLIRYNTDGTFDSTFGSGGIVTTAVGSSSQANAVVIQPDGKLLITGNSAGNLLLARYNTDGSLDSTFGTSGISVTLTGVVGRALALQTDGKIVVSGGDPLVRLKANGSLDATFGVGGVATTPITGFVGAYGVAVQTDGKIVVGAEGGSGSGTFLVMRYLGGANIVNVCA
ncbi:hypothetical protein JST99_02665 [Candidatus Dependentiae bacterium]|nr:hypothetical protein [Candidatus Dependentiae bacterium]MCC7415185.1 hypothetical protein [Campylobacterota bacterium]